MGINKVIYQKNVLIDITDSTVTPDTLCLGEIAYDASGEKIIGSFIGGEGVDTSDATATPNDILEGKTAYADGVKLTGTVAVNSSSDLDVNGATVTVPSGYYATDVSKTVATSTQATPTIEINPVSGLVTSYAIQEAGYVSSGTQTTTKQLPTQSSKTIMPGTSSKLAVEQGLYTTGDVTVAGDLNLAAENIKKGVSIFGVDGEYESKKLPELVNPAVAAELFENKELIDSEGNKLTGTFTLEEELVEQNELISQISTLVATKAAPSGDVDTSDATATAADIFMGKTAYVKGEKITGSYEEKSIETCTVTFKTSNTAYAKILFIQYTTLDSAGKVVGKSAAYSDITSGTFSIQCVCNTTITGIFPPTNISDVSYTDNLMSNLYANSSSGTFFWGTLAAAPGDTATITFS